MTTFASTLVLAAPVAIAAPAPDAPASFAMGGQPLLTVLGIGAQIYECRTKADGVRVWAFREPIAALIKDGQTVGRHYAGPNWEIGEGLVTGKVVASAPGATPDDVPALKLEVTAHRGGGPLQEAQVVLRLHTVGGALSGTCERDGELRSVPYRADYVFLK